MKLDAHLHALFILMMTSPAAKNGQPGKLIRDVLFHLRASHSAVAMPTIHDCGFEIIDRSPCSPDMPPTIISPSESSSAFKNYITAQICSPVGLMKTPVFSKCGLCILWLGLAS